ncbi:MAG: sporulation integral membrane protein YlbJ [Hyphomonadaceae bacterium]|nr:sporulation integral membrane protein YlbJ [Clostridia bacterium]
MRLGFGQLLAKRLTPIMMPLFGINGSGAFALVMGLVSGFPIGAMITMDLYKEKLLSNREAARLLAFTNNASPLFVIGTVAIGFYAMPQIGFVLVGCQVASALTVGLLLRLMARQEVARMPVNFPIVAKRVHVGRIFGECIENSVSVMGNICGFIVFFSVIIGLLGQIPHCPQALMAGFLEITAATGLIFHSDALPLILKLSATSLVLGWSGLSVHAQVVSVVGDSDISLIPYFAGKMLQGVFAALYTYVYFTLCPLQQSVFSQSVPHMTQATPPSIGMMVLFAVTFWLLSIALLMLLSMPFRGIMHKHH